MYSSKEVAWDITSLSLLWLLVERSFDSNGTLISKTSGSGKAIVQGILSICLMTGFTDNLSKILLHAILMFITVADAISSSSPTFWKADTKSSFFPVLNLG